MNEKAKRPKSESISKLPDELIEVILSLAGVGTAKTFVRILRTIPRKAMERIFEDRIIVINPHNFDGINEYISDDNSYLRIGGYDRLMLFFQYFGNHTKRIEIMYDFLRNHECHAISENIIKKYAGQLTEIRMRTLDDAEIWAAISNENGEILFPKVKKFHYKGTSSKNTLKLNSIFPELKSIELFGSIADAHCMSNIKNLNELVLSTISIEEHQLENIFANNKEITKLILLIANKIETLHSIEKHLKHLQILQIKYVGKEFLTRPKERLYNLSSITTFDVAIREISDFLGDLSFEMPNLKKLILRGDRIDEDIVHFINHFEKLESVEMEAKYTNTMNNFEISQLAALEKIFAKFDGTSSTVNTLKLLKFDDSEYSIYYQTMNDLNSYLKSTWTLSRGEQFNHSGEIEKYLIFKRDNSKCR